jgi:hypothetical protein
LLQVSGLKQQEFLLGGVLHALNETDQHVGGIVQSPRTLTLDQCGGVSIPFIRLRLSHARCIETPPLRSEPLQLHNRNPGEHFEINRLFLQPPGSFQKNV